MTFPIPKYVPPSIPEDWEIVRERSRAGIDQNWETKGSKDGKKKWWKELESKQGYRAKLFKQEANFEVLNYFAKQDPDFP